MPASGLNQMTAYYHNGETIDQLDNRRNTGVQRVRGVCETRLHI